MSGDAVRQAGGVVDGRHRLEGLLGHLLVQLGVGLEGIDHRAAQGLEFGGRLPGLQELLHLDLEKVGVGQILDDLGPELTFHQDLDGAVRQPQHLQDAGQGTHPVDFPFLGLVPAGVLLGAEKHVLLLPHGVLEGRNGPFPADKQGDHHGGKNDDIPQGQQRHVVPSAHFFSAFGAVQSKNHFSTTLPG